MQDLEANDMAVSHLAQALSNIRATYGSKAWFSRYLSAMAATETFVEAKIKEAEEKWRQQLHEETTQAKVELAKIKEEIQDMKASRSAYDSWKDKRSQIEQYKDKFALRKKDANHEKPTVKLNDDNYVEFKQQVIGWMKALHPIIKKVMENLERPENRSVDEDGIKEKLLEEMRTQAEDKYKIDIIDAVERQEREVFEEEW